MATCSLPPATCSDPSYAAAKSPARLCYAPFPSAHPLAVLHLQECVAVGVERGAPRAQPSVPEERCEKSCLPTALTVWESLPPPNIQKYQHGVPFFGIQDAGLKEGLSRKDAVTLEWISVNSEVCPLAGMKLLYLASIPLPQGTMVPPPLPNDSPPPPREWTPLQTKHVLAHTMRNSWPVICLL